MVGIADFLVLLHEKDLEPLLGDPPGYSRTAGSCTDDYDVVSFMLLHNQRSSLLSSQGPLPSVSQASVEAYAISSDSASAA
jgi:hypothetical protein